MTPLELGSIRQIRAELDSGAVTASDLLEEHLERVVAREPEVHALTTRTTDLARAQAADADRRLRAGERTPLLGIPVVVKDLVDVAGVATTAGSHVLADNVPATSATVWKRLEVAGVVLIGKANTHEFAYGGTTEPTRNPADVSRIVGGSSGGPAAALAAGYCLGAVASDTAGSIRIPANLCGVPGLKPTRGLVPTDGVIPLAPTLDVVGPMAARTADLDPLLRVMAADSSSPNASPTAAPRVGVVTPWGSQTDSVSEALANAVKALQALGSTLVSCELPGLGGSVGDNFTVIGFEANLYHQRWADQRDDYTPYVRDRLAQAASITRQDREAAVERAHDLEAQLDRLLDQVDVLLMPGVPMPASPAYDETVWIQGEPEDRDTALCRNTAFANLTGHPALCVPAGFDHTTDVGLPVGVQLVARHHDDLRLIALGALMEEQLESLVG